MTINLRDMTEEKKKAIEKQSKLKVPWHLEDAKCLQHIWIQRLATSLHDFATTTATCSDALFKWRVFLLQVHQHSPGAGCKISVRKPCTMARASRTVLNPSKIRRHCSFSTNSSYQEKKKRETSKLNKSNRERQYLHHRVFTWPSLWRQE